MVCVGSAAQRAVPYNQAGHVERRLFEHSTVTVHVQYVIFIYVKWLRHAARRGAERRLYARILYRCVAHPTWSRARAGQRGAAGVVLKSQQQR